MTAVWRLTLPVNMQALAQFGRDRNLLPPEGDPGYALHAALTAIFGMAAPRPFRLTAPARGRGALLLGYGGNNAAALTDARQLQAMDVPHFDAAAAVFELEKLVTHAMPQAWRPGQRLHFEVRVRPVVRTSRNDPRRPPGRISRNGKIMPGGGREIDAYLARKIQVGEGASLAREEVYRDWLLAGFARSGAVTLEPGALSLKHLTQTRLYTGDCALQNPPEGPDALFEGLLTITDAAKFGELVRRGLGRHRAFGFGMLLLAPAA